jgi:hypothetical protein
MSVEIRDLEDVLNEEIIKNQNNDGVTMQTSYEIKQFILGLLKKNWLFISLLIVGNIGIVLLYRKLFKK